jgi:hypothetical protein
MYKKIAKRANKTEYAAADLISFAIVGPTTCCERITSLSNCS